MATDGEYDDSTAAPRDAGGFHGRRDGSDERQ